MNGAINVTIGDHVVCFWFLDGVGGNWLAVLLLRNDEYHLLTRFRFFEDSEVWNSVDRMSTTNAVFKPGTTREEALLRIEPIVSVLAEMFLRPGASIERTDVNGDSFAFLAAMQRQPWAHGQVGEA